MNMPNIIYIITQRLTHFRNTHAYTCTCKTRHTYLHRHMHRHIQRHRCVNMYRCRHTRHTRANGAIMVLNNKNRFLKNKNRKNGS